MQIDLARVLDARVLAGVLGPDQAAEWATWLNSKADELVAASNATHRFGDNSSL